MPLIISWKESSSFLGVSLSGSAVCIDDQMSFFRRWMLTRLDTLAYSISIFSTFLSACTSPLWLKPRPVVGAAFSLFSSSAPMYSSSPSKSPPKSSNSSALFVGTKALMATVPTVTAVGAASPHTLSDPVCPHRNRSTLDDPPRRRADWESRARCCAFAGTMTLGARCRRQRSLSCTLASGGSSRLPAPASALATAAAVCRVVSLALKLGRPKDFSSIFCRENSINPGSAFFSPFLPLLALLFFTTASSTAVSSPTGVVGVLLRVAYFQWRAPAHALLLEKIALVSK
mmetsp:Transcript_18226/g.39718  ORF Transcript_18226/g.39718 Transcript_18226/m.39718 type:complete len:287 (-) Transcript_18226:1292-2152(-)